MIKLALIFATCKSPALILKQSELKLVSEKEYIFKKGVYYYEVLHGIELTNKKSAYGITFTEHSIKLSLTLKF